MTNSTEPKKVKNRRMTKGFLNPKIIRAITFYVISACVILSVLVCILAIWDYAETDVFWRMIATFAVIAVGSAIFAFVNNIFGLDEEN